MASTISTITSCAKIVILTFFLTFSYFQLHVAEEELEVEVQEAGHLEVVELRLPEEEEVHLNNFLKFSSSVEESIQFFIHVCMLNFVLIQDEPVHQPTDWKEFKWPILTFISF